MNRSLDPITTQHGYRIQGGDLTKSLHHLNNVASKSPNGYAETNNDQQLLDDNRPVVRRKRYTRRQRKSLIIEPNTGYILASRPSSSSEEEDQGQSRAVSASLFDLNTSDRTEEKQKYRGPSARRVEKRLHKLAGISGFCTSTGNLEKISSDAKSSLRAEQRCLSVRDLKGEEHDFTNRDSVTKWTSQILAELASLPSSCVDLRQPTSSIKEHRRSALSEIGGERLTTSNYISSNSNDRSNYPRLPSKRDEQSEKDGMTQSMTSWMTPMDNRMTNSAIEYTSSASNLSSDNSLEKKGWSLNRRFLSSSQHDSGLMGSSTESDEIQTPTPGSPVFMDSGSKVPVAPKEPPPPLPTAPIPAKRSIIMTSSIKNGMTTSLYDDRRTGNRLMTTSVINLATQPENSKTRSPPARMLSTSIINLAPVNERRTSLFNGTSNNVRRSTLNAVNSSQKTLTPVDEIARGPPRMMSSVDIPAATMDTVSSHMTSSVRNLNKIDESAVTSTRRVTSSFNINLTPKGPPLRQFVPTTLSIRKKSPESVERRSIGVQGVQTPLFSNRRSSEESTDEYIHPILLKNIKVSPCAASEHPEIKSHKGVDHHDNYPTPAKRTIPVKSEETAEAVKFRGGLTESDERLLKNIERLSKTFGRESNTSDRISQASIPSISTTYYTSHETLNGDSMLQKWMKNSECRSRLDSGKDVGKSVDSIVASMIRSIEDSRFEAADRPSTLLLSPKPQDASTQTSPYSISRSSSFDWMNEISESKLRDLKTPISTPRSARFPASGMDFSSSETDDADREVAEMTRRVENLERKNRNSALIREAAGKNQKILSEMDESLQMLMKVTEDQAQHLPIVQPRHNQRCQPSNMTESIYDNMDRRKYEEDDGGQLERTISHLVSHDKQSIDIRNQSIKPKNERLTEENGRNSDAENINVKMEKMGGRAGSCDLLDAETSQTLTASADRIKKIESEAEECCEWLRRAGFPQYAIQFQEGDFPIDIRSVRKDHPFLEVDSLRSLYRRLDALNRCAIMRINNVVLRPRNENYMDMYGREEEDNIALSNNWQYERSSHTWSRVGNEQMYGAPGRIVSISQNHRDPYAVKDTRHMPYNEIIDMRSDRSDQRTESSTSSGNGKLQRSQSERIKDTAKALMKKMNPRSSSRRRREPSRDRDGAHLLISDPVLVSYGTASPEMSMNLRPTTLTQDRGRLMSSTQRSGRSKSVRRQGLVVVSPSTGSSSFEDSPPKRNYGRDRSMPPRMINQSFSPFSSTSSPYYQPYTMEKTQLDDFLYDNALKSRRGKPYSPYADYGSTTSSPLYSSPYSCRSTTSYATPPYRISNNSRNINPPKQALNIDEDGYYVHGSFESAVSKRKHRMDVPSTSAGLSQLRVNTLRENKSQSSLDQTDEEPPHSGQLMTRRDSGVGSSLSRSPSGPSTQRIRQSYLLHSLSLATSSNSSGSSGSWNRNKIPNERLITSSVTTSGASDDSFFTDEQLLKTINALPVLDLIRLRKLAFLRITSMLEKFMGCSMANCLPMESTDGAGTSGQKNWTVQKLLRKIKHNENRKAECAVFGQPLDTVYRKNGQSFPRTITEVLRYLRQLAPETVGIFRKNGVKSRIAELRSFCDREADGDVFVDKARLDSGQIHDVADMLKQYLRDLPDPLMTSRLSPVFSNIFIHVPESERMLAIQYAVLLLPDEHREALQTLLFFLHDVAKHSDVNQMSAQNLAVCFTPSLFQLSASRLDKISSNRRHKTIGAMGMPTESEMRETRAAQLCLTHMINHCRQTFMAPEHNAIERYEIDRDLPLLKNLSPHGPRAFLIDKVAELVTENAERWKGWIVEGTIEGVEVSSRKTGDDNPLRQLRAWVDIAAPPKEVMYRVMKERSLWDHRVINWRSIDMVQYPDTDIHQFVLNDAVGHPTRDCYVVRYHRIDMLEPRGACAIAERSIQCSETQLLGGVSAAVLDSRFLIEPKNGYSRVTHVTRVDLRGRSPAWYGRVYGNVLARQMARLKETFRKNDPSSGPETKV